MQLHLPGYIFARTKWDTVMGKGIMETQWKRCFDYTTTLSRNPRFKYT